MADDKQTSLLALGGGKPADLATIAKGLEGSVPKEELEKELEDQRAGLPPAPPRLKIDNSDRGAHNFYMDMAGTNIDLGEEIVGVIVDYDDGRAYFVDSQDDDALICGGVNGVPIVDEPQHPTCEGCPMNTFGSACKPQIRVLFMMEHEGKNIGVIWYLSVTALKYFTGKKGYIRQLSNMNTPAYMVLTKVTLKDNERAGGQRWGTPEFSAVKALPKEIIDYMKEERQKYRDWLQSGGEEKLAENPGKDAMVGEEKEEKTEEGGGKAPF